MAYTTLISTAELANHLTDPDWVIVDCRFSLADPERGRRDYHQEHIPGAVFADLEHDLSGPIIPGQTGRHPLPDIDTFVQTLSRWGIGPGVQAIIYDDDNGSMAARLWWMLRWLGHAAVAVLDGGWSHWQREGRPARSDTETATPRRFIARPRPELLANAEDVLAIRSDPRFRLVDARSAERYRGDQEPIDPVAEHIPGAISGPYSENLDPDGRFRSPDELRARFQALLGDVPAGQTVFYCGSGVSAAHNVLGMAHAGLGDARLYAGSWSEWITDPDRPVAKGE